MALQLYRTRLDKEISFSDNFKSPDTFVTWHGATGNGAVDISTPHQRSPSPKKDLMFQVWANPGERTRSSLPFAVDRCCRKQQGSLWLEAKTSSLPGHKGVRRVVRVRGKLRPLKLKS